MIADDADGRLNSMVDLVINGANRAMVNSDVYIGVCLKALVAYDNGVPFYLALPSPTIDFSIDDGRGIPIEQRAADEVTTMAGRTSEGRIVPHGSPVASYAFDVTPARLVSGLITERGVLQADREALAGAFPSGWEVHDGLVCFRSAIAAASGSRIPRGLRFCLARSSMYSMTRVLSLERYR